MMLKINTQQQPIIQLPAWKKARDCARQSSKESEPKISREALVMAKTKHMDSATRLNQHDLNSQQLKKSQKDTQRITVLL